MRIIVIGSGVIGVTSAWYLSNAGHEVTVIDRQESPARETSFANGGQISVGQAEPWANPAAPLKILKWLGREDAPLLFRLRSDLNQWSWALKFLPEVNRSKALLDPIFKITYGLIVAGIRPSFTSVRASFIFSLQIAISQTEIIPIPPPKAFP